MSFTRDFVGTFPVPCLDQTTFDASCGGSGTNTFTGKILDRLAAGFPRWQAAQPVAFASYDGGTSTANSRYASVSVKIQHSNTTSTSATGALGWADFSTGYQSCEQPLFIITNTTSTISSTGSNSGGYLSSAPTATTSTGIAISASSPSWYPIDQAQQFLRIVITPRVEASSSGGGVLTLSGALIFGQPQYAGVGSNIQSVNLGGGVQGTTSTGAIIKSTS